MTPSTQLEVPSEVDPTQTAHVETLVLELAQAHPRVAEVPGKPRKQFEDGTFQSSMIETNRMKSGTKGFNFFVSLFLNATVLATPILAGLYFTDTLNLKQFESTFLVAPPPPPPPPAAPAVAVKAPPVRRVFENAGKLLAPVAIPKNIAQIKEAPIPDDVALDGVAGGVPGGVAGGSMGGVIGGVIGGVHTAVAAPLAPKEPKPKAPVRVGGRVREPQLIKKVEPRYPPLALATHLQGAVVIEAILDENGNVVEMRVVSGHPLLIDSAVAAVKQWKYQPTYLNDQPVPVQMNITVTFQLNQ